MKYLAAVKHKIVEQGDSSISYHLLADCLSIQDYKQWITFVKSKSIGDDFSIFQLHEEYVATSHKLKEN